MPHNLLQPPRSPRVNRRCGPPAPFSAAVPPVAPVAPVALDPLAPLDPFGFTSSTRPVGLPPASIVTASNARAPNSSRVELGGAGSVRNICPLRRSQPNPVPAPSLNSQQNELSNAPAKNVSDRESGSVSAASNSRSYR